MTRDSVVAETTPLLAVSEETPLLQANDDVTRIHPELLQQPQAQPASTTTPAANNGADDNGNNENSQNNDQDEDEDEDKPLPLKQIFLLCYCRLVEPIAFFSIFPYINMMIEEVGDVEERDVGFYSGLIESLFSLTQMTLMIFWGRTADRYGRKPVLVFSLTGVGIAICLFGLSQKIWQMIIFRCLAGVFSGSVVTIRAMITENSTHKTSARAFSFFAFAGNIGIFLGPIIGGVLANPAKQYGRPFSSIPFFVHYPYALPSFAAGSFGLSAALIGAFFVDETLQTKKSPASGGKPAPPPMSIPQLLRSPGVALVLLFISAVAVLGLAFTAVTPVFWFTSVSLGGYGFSPLQISLFLGAAGLSQAFWTLAVFPPAQQKWGTMGVLRFCMLIWPLSFVIAPILSFCLRKGLDPLFWVAMTATTVLGSAAGMGMTGMQLALNDVAPSPAVLGTLNAVALALMCAIRAVVPALFASLFAVGVKKQILGGYLVWAVLVPMAVVPAVLLRWLPERKHGKVVQKRADEDDEEAV